MEFTSPYNDPGDRYDTMKWDFPEDSLKEYFIEGYLYKANNKNNAKLLHYIRGEISRLVAGLYYMNDQDLLKLYNSSNPPYSYEEFIEGLKEFVDMHEERVRGNLFSAASVFQKRIPYGTSSRYLLSEVPKEGRKTFLGINKPRMRYGSNRPSTGIDGRTRCIYRDVFLNLDLSNKRLKELIYHELGHGVAGHLRYRDKENHLGDHKLSEKLLKIVGDRIGFLDR
jgi:hypothetical protein